MSDFAIVTDSSCSLPAELVDEYGITVIPILIEWQGRFVRDGVDVDAGQVYDYLRSDPSATIRTSTPSPGDFIRVYDALLQRHSGILSIHLAGTLTSIVEIARQAAEAKGPQVIEVVDGRTASMALGFAVLAAARAREQGAGLEEAAKEARAVGERARLFGLLETLYYVRSSGRLKGLGMKAGTSLHLRPLIVVGQGQVRYLGMVRSRARGIDKLIDLVERESRQRPLHASVVHAGVPEEAHSLAIRLCDRLDCVEMIESEFTPVLGGHTGPGFVGVSFYS